MERLQRYIKPLLAVSLAVILLLSGAAVAQARKINTLNDQLSAGYVRAVYESAELMRSVEINLRKLKISASGAQMQSCLNDIARQAQGAESAFTTLPLSGEAIQAATKSINQMSDFSISLANRLARGGAVTEEDAGNIDLLTNAAISINNGLAEMIDQLESGEEIASLTFDTIPIGETVTDEAGEYPALIYDGPFSDAAKGENFKALSGGEVTAEQAAQMLLAYMGADTIDSIRPDGESSIPIEVFEFTLQRGDLSMSAAVTKTGGHVLYVLPSTQVDSKETIVEDCLNSAKAFLQRNGYGEMAVSYSYQYQNILTVNCAAMQDGVLLYPDLVKVQVSMADGSVIGVECANYLKNHAQRALPEPLITAEEAIQRVNADLEPEFARLALIPLNTLEVLTYEIAAKDDYDNQFLIYIDAATGQERQIYQLVSDENGTLAE